ncbi:MAG: caspase family protein [Saprospiraceae bacterium]
MLWGGLPNSPLTEINRGKNHLFAIGINTYANFPKLTNAKKDIEDISDILVTQYSFDNDNVQVILDEQASRQNIIDRLDALRATVQPNDRLLWINTPSWRFYRSSKIDMLKNL